MEKLFKICVEIDCFKKELKKSLKYDKSPQNIGTIHGLDIALSFIRKHLKDTSQNDTSK